MSNIQARMEEIKLRLQELDRQEGNQPGYRKQLEINYERHSLQHDWVNLNRLLSPDKFSTTTNY